MDIAQLSDADLKTGLTFAGDVSILYILTSNIEPGLRSTLNNEASHGLALLNTLL